jgi:hypothetical protein
MLRPAGHPLQRAERRIVYHGTPTLHFDLDFFRAEPAWFAVNKDANDVGLAAPKQVVWVSNDGMTIKW